MRTLILTLFLSLIFPFVTNGATGFLSETVPWPQWPPIEYKALSLTSTPPSGAIVSPKGENIRYATIDLGNGKIDVAIQLGDEPLVWVDANNNQNLCDDGTGEPKSAFCQPASGTPAFNWEFKVQVPYEINGHSFTQPYYLKIFGDKWGLTNDNWHFSYVCGGMRKGLIDLGGRLYGIYIGDRNSDGLYNDIENLTVFIDVNHDGKIAWGEEVYEMFSPPTFPIQVGKNVYAIKSADPAGRVIDLEKTGETTPPPVLTPGNPAPDFTAKTVDGTTLTLSDYRGKVVILLSLPFKAYQNSSSCSSCTKPDLLQRALELQKMVQGEPRALQDSIVIIGFASDPEPPSASLIKGLGIKFPVIWNPRLIKLYRLSGMVVLDQKGIIQLTANTNYIIKSDGVHITDIRYCNLGAWEIMEKVEQLLKR
jgi:peroxiredoxin Q/BCP